MTDPQTQFAEQPTGDTIATPLIEPHLKGQAEDIFREMWASLFFSGRVKGKTVMLCSASSGEGVTTVACGLALAGTTPPGPAHVALVDLNLRNPSVHDVLGLPEAPGVTDVLAGQVPASRAAQRVNESLDVYTIGRAAGGVLQTLQSGALQNFLASLEQGYTHVILDVAAVNPFPDAQILAGLAGNVVMVTHSGQTPREAIAQARKRLEAGGASLVGAVLNFRTYPIPRFLYRRAETPRRRIGRNGAQAAPETIMLMLGQQKIDALSLAFVAALVAAVTALSVLVPETMPWSYVALALLPVVLYTAVRWEITLWAWFWVLSFGLLDIPQARFTITGFFNMTVPRFILLVAVIAFGIHFMLRRRRGIHFDRGLLWAMLVLALICGISAARTGWLAQTESVRTAPYYRFLEAMVFPFLVFFLVYNATRDERQIRTALLALSAYVWYALYIGYLQYAALRGAESLRALIWPSYINDPLYGIHFDRARGAFGSAGQQAILLILVFYGNLFLLRKIRGVYRGALLLQTVLILPAIFFTGVRSAFVAFLLCGILWCLLAARGRLGGVKLALSALALLVMTTVFWGRRAQTDRQTGGVADPGPVIVRSVLAHQTWLLVQEHPLTGVGFGKFVDAQRTMRLDPTSLAGMSAGVLVEHNLFLNMVAEVGIPGLLAVVLVFFLVFRESVILYRRLPKESEGWLCRTFVVLFWVALINYLTDAMFRDTYWDAFANGLFWAMAALVVGYNRMLGPVAQDSRLAAAAV